MAAVDRAAMAGVAVAAGQAPITAGHPMPLHAAAAPVRIRVASATMPAAI